MKNKILNSIVSSSKIEDRFVFTLFTHNALEKTMYGIKITDLLNDNSSQVFQITSIEKDAKNMYNIIKENIIHPVHLEDVVYNLILM